MSYQWPSFEHCEHLAQSASALGLEIKLVESGADGWAWTWLHVTSGMTFDGSTTAMAKEVALVCALMAMPVIVGFQVDKSTDS